MTGAKVLTQDEEQSLVTHCTRLLREHGAGLDSLAVSRRDEFRNALMMLTMLDIGCRPSELVGIRVKDISPLTNTVFINALKGSKSRELPLQPGRMAQIRWYLLRSHNVTSWRLLDPEALVFDITYSRLVAIWYQYRPCKKKLHSMRHTFAVRFFLKNRNIKALQLALGHVSIMSTIIYMDFVYTSIGLRGMMYGQKSRQEAENTLVLDGFFHF